MVTPSQLASQYAGNTGSLRDRAHRYAELAVSSQRWEKLSPVLIAPMHRGMARLSGP